MNVALIFFLGFLVGTLVLDAVAEALNLRSFGASPPPEFESMVSREQYAKSRRYLGENVRLDMARRVVTLAALLAAMFLGGFDAADRFARSFSLGSVGTGLIFAGVLTLARFAISLPFSVYDTFVIEERYGFNRMTPRTFASDLLKGAVLTALLGGAVFSGVVLFFEKAGGLAWLYAWLALTAFQLALMYLAPAVILPMFNRFEPLAEGELRSAIEAYARGRSFALSGIYTMDGSRRSSKANAFFTGFGRLRKLVLFDTLVSKNTVSELVAVLAHEIGHFELRHIPKSAAISVATSGVGFYALSRLIGNTMIFEAFGMSEVSVYASLVFVSLVLSPAVRLLSLPTSWLSRRFEFEADRFARATYGHPEELISALKKLSADHLSHLTPHGLKVALDYSHPPVLKRIETLRAGR